MLLLVPKSPGEKDALVEHHYRRFMELLIRGYEWDAALMLATAPVSLAWLSSAVAPHVRECRLR